MKDNANFILTVDMGTTAFKAAVFDTAGNECGNYTLEYSLLTPHPGWAELAVSQYVETFRASVQGALIRSNIQSSQLLAIGLSCQCETSVYLSAADVPLRNAIVWLDNRATAEAKEIVDEFGSSTVQRRTGQVGEDAIWPGAKLLWLKKHEPYVFRKINKTMQLNSYMAYILTGKAVAEDSMLGSCIYFDVNERTYWPEMLQFIGITPEQLPEIVTPGAFAGTVTERAATLFGLTPGTPVSIGATDLACGSIGTGNIKPGSFSDSTGSSLCTMTMVDHLVLDPTRQMPCYCSAIPGTFMIHAYAAGGMYIRWFRDVFGQLEHEAEKAGGMNAYDRFDQLAAEVPAGSNGLIALPHLQGSGPPDLNPNARASFIGITLAHDKRHFIRAMMEGVTMVLRRIIDATENLEVNIEKIVSLGGGAYSPLWCQIKADATGKTLVTTKNHENACCLGAAVLAGVELGVWPSLEDACSHIIQEDKIYTPNPERKPIYDRLLKDYQSAMAGLGNLFG